MSHRILLIEDSEILRAALGNLLNASGCFEKVAVAGSLSRALEALHNVRPSVVFLGPNQAGAHQADLAEGVLRNAPDAKIVVYVLQDDEEAVAALFRIGVAGVVATHTASEALPRALIKVAEGGVYCEYNIDDLLGYSEAHVSSCWKKLAPRERRVLNLISDGKSSKEIANELDLGVETVRYYRKSIMRKLKVHNVATLLRVANAEHLIPMAASRRG